MKKALVYILATVAIILTTATATMFYCFTHCEVSTDSEQPQRVNLRLNGYEWTHYTGPAEWTIEVKED